MKRIAVYHRCKSADAARVKDLFEPSIQAHSDWQVVDYYIDTDRSGMDKNREQLQRLITDIKCGNVDMVLVEHYGKLHRNAEEMSGFLSELNRQGVTLFRVVTASKS